MKPTLHIELAGTFQSNENFSLDFWKLFLEKIGGAGKLDRTSSQLDRGFDMIPAEHSFRYCYSVILNPETCLYYARFFNVLATELNKLNTKPNE